MWSPAGTELFWGAGLDQLAGATVTTKPSFAFSSPSPLPRALLDRGPAFERDYDRMPDRRRNLTFWCAWSFMCNRFVSSSLVALILVVSLRAGAPALSSDEVARAIDLGRRCTAPIVRIQGTRRQDFDVYIETPLGRAALAVATATVMHVSLDSLPVKRAMQESRYRVWGDFVSWSRRSVSVDRIAIHPMTGAEITPVGQQYERFFVGTAPSHGIIEPLRARFGEAVFDALPAGDFDVVFHTTAGRQTYHVTKQDRDTLLHVCN
jgi:hypothetical protein